MLCRGVDDMPDFNCEQILLCLEQKSLLMKDIMNLTKRIEVEARQEEFDLNPLLADRQNRIERIIKCDKLISDELGSLDSDAKNHLKELLDGNEGAAGSEAEMKMVEAVLTTKNYLNRTREIDKSAMAILVQKREEARAALVEINNEKSANE